MTQSRVGWTEPRKKRIAPAARRSVRATLRQQRRALQTLLMKALQQFHLVLFIAAFHEQQELLFQLKQRLLVLCGFLLQCRVDGGLGLVPEGLQVQGVGRGQVLQAGALLLDEGELGEGVDGEEQGAGFLAVDVQHLDLHLHVGVHVVAEVGVDQFELAVGELVDQQAVYG
jgi:hypothetical protein